LSAWFAASDGSSRYSSGMSSAFNGLATFSYTDTRPALPRRPLVAR
jgi:hypothetical protein